MTTVAVGRCKPYFNTIWDNRHGGCHKLMQKKVQNSCYEHNPGQLEWSLKS